MKMTNFSDETMKDVLASGPGHYEGRKLIEKKCETCGKTMLVLSQEVRFCCFDCIRTSPNAEYSIQKFKGGRYG